jgi:hypothetical protein
MEGRLKHQIIMVTEGDMDSVQRLTEMLTEGWIIDRADAMQHSIIYVLRRYEEEEETRP